MENVNTLGYKGCKNLTANNHSAFITDLSHEGRGITYIDGKITFVQNALPGENVLLQITKKNAQYNEAKTLEVVTPSPDRVIPKCSHYGICGGCSYQHISTEMQLKHKEKTLLEQLAHIASTQPNTLLPPMQACAWGYRRRARLGVKYVTKKQAVLVGFREKNGRYLAQLHSCETLVPEIAQLILPLQQLIGTLKAYQAIPQIEAVLGDDGVALVFRHLVSLNEEDSTKLKIFAKTRQLRLYLQSGNESTIHCIWPEIKPKPLSYRLNLTHPPGRPIELLFEPNHFIQINAMINEAMINQAIKLLALTYSDRLLDLFCGLGNFSLALAMYCQSVTGVEVSAQLVVRARENAKHNAISNVAFYATDLSQPINTQAWSQQQCNKLLLDPPRSGAIELIQHLSSWPIERIVYISCNSASLARDSGELVKQGYSLQQAGVMDMFPHTQHSEIICLFTR